MPQTQRLKEIINEQHIRISRLEDAVMKVRNDCTIYKQMWQDSDMNEDVRESITGQFESVILPLDRMMIKS